MSATVETHVGSPRSRVDGPLKVTGRAKYAAEFTASGLLHGVVVSSPIATGRIIAIDTDDAEAVRGVVRVFTHANRPREPWFESDFHDQTAPPGKPFRPLASDRIAFSGQPVALVVAEDFETARYAASLLRVHTQANQPRTDLEAARGDAYIPAEPREGIATPPEPRGSADAALRAAPVRIEREYRIAGEHHNPMEPHATTVVWEGAGKLTVYDKTQGVQASQDFVTSIFGLDAADVRVIAPFVGGAFGAGLRPQYQLFLAVMATLALRRSVRVVLERDQMFTFDFRPITINTVAIGAERDGTLRAIRHAALQGTSHFEDHQEVVVNWSGLLYDCANVELGYQLAKLDTYTPGDMRAPGAPLGLFALESALDELAYELNIDPLALRLRNYTERDANEDKPFTSKALRDAYRQGAERFGWGRRSAAPRSMREGRELIGWGMATGVWEAMFQQLSARVTIEPDGHIEVASAAADIGTGTYTILAQIAADALGVAMDRVTVRLGDSSLPKSPVEGGSWTAASAGTAVTLACEAVRKRLFSRARALDASPLANIDLARMVLRNGRIAAADDPARSVAIADALRSGAIAEEATAEPDAETKQRFSAYTHSAVFVEVRVDEALGVVRVTRVVNAVAAGRIINPKTGRSQVIGGVVFGLSMALEEESMLDHHIGRFMNHNLAEYHIPVNADIPPIDVVFVDEHDDKASPIGVKGVGEIGVVGTAAAVANAVFHATGRRVRSLPITIDKLLAADALA